MSWIREKLGAYGERIACIEAGREWTYAEFLGLIEKIAQDLPSGDPTIIEVAGNSTVEGLAKLLAIAESSHIALPLPTQIPPHERERMRAIAKESSLYAKLDRSGLILFSSGTSGEPKGMLHNLDSLLRRYQASNPRQDRSLLLLLIDHIGGLDSAFRCLFAGSTLVIPEARTPDAAAAAIRQYRVNVLPASPTFLNLMLLSKVHEKYDLSSLEIIAYGAEAMPQALLQRLDTSFPKAKLQQKFGTSETGAIRIKSVENSSLFFRIEDDETEWKVIDRELWLRTPSRIIGYLNSRNDSLESEGWYRTGDFVESDEQGNLRIIGRLNDIINVGGQKVHPNEVAQVLQSIPGIEDAHVYGEDDPITGARVCAQILTSKSEQSTLVWKRVIRSHCCGRLTPWKIPSHIVLCRELGVTSRLKRDAK